MGNINKELEKTFKNIVTSIINGWLEKSPEERVQLESQGLNLPGLISKNVLIRKEFSSFNEIKEILIMIDQGIGNLIMLTPAIKALKEILPQTKISVLCKFPSNQVIEGLPYIDEVLLDMKDKFYDVIICTHWSLDFQKKYKDYIEIYGRRVYNVQATDFNVHEAYHNLDLTTLFGYEGKLPDADCVIDWSFYDEQKVKLASFKKENNLKGLIAISDTTLDLEVWQVKRWGYYEELIKILNSKGYGVILIGGSKELEEYKNKNLGKLVIKDYLGTTTIPQTAAIIKLCDKFIGNDSGPGHISATTGIPTYILFGPTLISKNKPLGKNVFVISDQFKCGRCQYTDRFQTCQAFKCMPKLTAKYVYDFVINGYREKKSALIAGVFGGNALRTEEILAKTLENFGYKVLKYNIRERAKEISPYGMTSELVAQVVNFDPTITIICGGKEIVPDVLKKIRPFSKTKLMSWYLDFNGIEDWHTKLCSICDYNFWTCGDEVILSIVSKQSGKPVYFIPFTNLGLFPKLENIEKKRDVVFIGSYSKTIREILIKACLENGINIDVFGNGWPEKGFNWKGKSVLGNEFLQTIKESKIVLQTHQYMNSPNIELMHSDRIFYPMALGEFQLVDKLNGYESLGFIEGENIVTYSNISEAIEKIKYYLEHEEERKQIALNSKKLFRDRFEMNKIWDCIESLINKEEFPQPWFGSNPKISFKTEMNNLVLFEHQYEKIKYFKKFYNLVVNKDFGDFKDCLQIDANNLSKAINKPFYQPSIKDERLIGYYGIIDDRCKINLLLFALNKLGAGSHKLIIFSKIQNPNFMEDIYIKSNQLKIPIEIVNNFEALKRCKVIVVPEYNDYSYFYPAEAMSLGTPVLIPNNENYEKIYGSNCSYFRENDFIGLSNSIIGITMDIIDNIVVMQNKFLNENFSMKTLEKEIKEKLNAGNN